jgi:mRNA interferase HicA
LRSYPYAGTIFAVKRQELESALRALGWYFLKHGGSHDLWAHLIMKRKLVIPRHKEIKEYLARSILRQAVADE